MVGLKELVLTGTVERAEHEVQWAERVPAWLDEYARRHPDLSVATSADRGAADLRSDAQSA